MGVARFFDFIFAGGFGTLAALYIFFCLFMIGCSLRLELIFLNMGFLNNVLLKSIFYIFLASIAFGNIGFWACDTVGCIFVGMSVINLIRYFGANKETEEEKLEDAA